MTYKGTTISKELVWAREQAKTNKDLDSLKLAYRKKWPKMSGRRTTLHCKAALKWSKRPEKGENITLWLPESLVAQLKKMPSRNEKAEKGIRLAIKLNL